MENIYGFRESNEVVTPALIYYRDIIKENIQKAVKLAGGPDHLWPHVKTHKMAQMVKLQMEAGITRFKCSTIAEAEMAADCSAADVLVAYPLVGPNIKRFLHLTNAYPSVRFWAIGDDLSQLSLLGQTFSQFGLTARVLVDVNMGMDRTGVSFDKLHDFYVEASCIEGICMKGLHCYDGHRTEKEFSLREAEAKTGEACISGVMRQLEEDSLKPEQKPEVLVIGGTPSFPCHLDFEHAFYSPGTLFVNDYGYTKKFPDLSYTPGAAVLTRVISCPLKGHFTLDLGYKGIASDPEGTRGIIAGMDHVVELFQSEEHWAFCMEDGYEDLCPKTGDELFVIPTHICPTSALYVSVPVVENGQVCASWQVTARSRKLTY